MADRGRGTTQLQNMFVADFETTDSDRVYRYDTKTDEPIHYQRVWLAGYKNLQTMESTYHYSLDDFMKDILARHDNTHREYAFHNLKFDGSYIIPWLMNNKYTVSEGKPQPGEFSVLVDSRNNWYNITVQCTKRRKITIWCSQKLFPTALRYLPEIYGTPTQKIAEDQDFYTKPRPEGYVPDERDMQYFENDLQVPAETLNKHIELYGLRFKKTQASQSYHNFEQEFPAWRWRFNALTDDVDKAVRPAYWGGIAYVPPHKAGKDHYGVNVMDITSSYPHKASKCKLPYGLPLYEFGEGKHPDMSKFWVAEILAEFELKDENHLPCIPAKAIIEGGIMEDKESDHDKWLVESDGIVRMTVSSIDYMTIQKSYKFKVVRWLWSIHWAWKIQPEVARFVDTRFDQRVKYKALAKVETDPQKKREYKTMDNRAKIDINSFYGKFGEEVIKEGKTPHLEYEEDLDEEVVVWKTDRVDIATEYNRKFLPVAIAITAWGRQQLVEMANLLGEHFLYCDTDSVHYLKEGGQEKIDNAVKNGTIDISRNTLGAWDFEGSFIRGRFLRAKCYMEECEKKGLLATVAGLPADPDTGNFSKKRSCLNWDNFHIGTTIPPEQSNKLRTVSTPTGNKLVPTGFKITEKETLFG